MHDLDVNMYPAVRLFLRLNGRELELSVEPRETLAYVIRDRLGLTGTKISCDSQVCGACTVLLDDLPISACTALAMDALGKNVLTIEGLAREGQLHPVQEVFLDQGAFQCGFCTPGFILTAVSLIKTKANPTREEVIDWLEGNICRCTGYESIVTAVLQASIRVGESSHQPDESDQ